jgi:hypothetical protein
MLRGAAWLCSRAACAGISARLRKISESSPPRPENFQLAEMGRAPRARGRVTERLFYFKQLTIDVGDYEDNLRH